MFSLPKPPATLLPRVCHAGFMRNVSIGICHMAEYAIHRPHSRHRFYHGFLISYTYLFTSLAKIGNANLRG